MDKSSCENLVGSKSSFPKLPSTSTTTDGQPIPGINLETLETAFNFPALSIEIPSLSGNRAGYYDSLLKLGNYSLQKSDKPAQLFFEADRVNDPLFLNIFCDQSFYFVNNLVSFTVEVQNLPRDSKMGSESFQAILTSPNGKKEPCLLEPREHNIIGASFNGSFWSGNEVGVYDINVRIIIPLIWSGTRCVSKDGGVLRGSLSIPVSRNYVEESRNEMARICCEYKTLDETTRHSSSTKTSFLYRIASNCGNRQQRHLCKLWGLTSDLRTNNIFYTDRNAHVVVCASLEGHTLFKFGEFGSSPGTFFRPTGIAYDNEHGRLLVADKDNHRICFYSTDGQYISSFGMQGHENGSFNYPWDVDVSRDGQHIVVSDSRNKRIQLFDRFGNFLNKYSVFEESPFEHTDELNYPRGISFDEAGNNIYVTDFNAHNVIQVSLDCSQHRKMFPDGKLCRPQGVTVDGIGNLLIADTSNHCIRHVTPKSDLISEISRIHKSRIEFPANVTTIAGGYVAVLHGNGTISIF